MTFRTTPRRAVATLLLAAVGTSLAACGDDEKTTASTPKPNYEGVYIGNATDLTKKPKIVIPDVLAPTGNTIVKKDIVVGTGPTVKTGDELTARYVGQAWSTDKQFDASWDRAEKEIPFTLAKGSVIDGWTEGLPGMKVGGRRLLIVPPSKGYGDQGQGQDIAGGETLVFVVDAKKTKKGQPAPAAPATGSGGANEAMTPDQIQQAIQEAAAKQQAGK